MTRETFRRLLRNGDLDDRRIEIDVPSNSGNRMQIDAPGGQMALQELVIKVDKMFSRRQTEKKRMKISAARPLLEEMETDRLLNFDNIAKEALKTAEDEGIVFIDEIDKIVTPSDVRHGTEASSEGVQQVYQQATNQQRRSACNQRSHSLTRFVSFCLWRFQDLLPIVEGCSINTKYGNVSTDHILFIASGAFHSCKPSDMVSRLHRTQRKRTKRQCKLC